MTAYGKARPGSRVIALQTITSAILGDRRDRPYGTIVEKGPQTSLVKFDGESVPRVIHRDKLQMVTR